MPKQYYVIRSGSTNDELYHHGIKGMKWGVRRFQKKDGSLTSARAKRYATVGDDELKTKKQAYKQANKEYSKAYNSAYKYSSHHPISQWASEKRSAESNKRWDDAINKAKVADARKQEYKQAKQEYKEVNKEALAARRKRAIKIGAAAAGTALAAYGAYKVNKYIKTKNCQIAAKRGYELAEKRFHERVATEMTRKAMTGSTRTIHFQAHSPSQARSFAQIAKKDNFRQAVKNVNNYVKENGKKSLKYLPSVDSYKGGGSAISIIQKAH